MPHEVRDIEPPKENSLSVNFKTREVKLSVVSEQFVDNDYLIIYIPSLQLSAYGKTEDEASYMMWSVVMEEFCEMLLKLTPIQLFEYLSTLGWQAKTMEDFKSSSFVDKDGLLKNFNLPEDTLIQEKVLEF